jgi:hypothetical protein
MLILTVQYGHAGSNYTQLWVHFLREEEEEEEEEGICLYLVINKFHNVKYMFGLVCSNLCNSQFTW